MGLYKFSCKNCGHTDEEIMSYEEIDTFLNSMSCSCGGELTRDISIPRLSLQSQDNQCVHNSNGYYSQAFGRYFKNQMHMYDWAERNGYVRVTEEQADAAIYGQADALTAQDKIAQDWTDNLKQSGGDKVQAAIKTFVPKNLQ